MKHYFIVNPVAAGRGKERLVRDIHAIWSTGEEEYEIYETASKGDGERFVRDRCRDASAHTVDRKESNPMRFYACGGDGTLNEVVNGVMSAGNDMEIASPEIGSIPLGTGNDFVRNFPDANFKDLLAQFRGEARACDVIRYEAAPAPARYCINMFNIGFDCAVVDKTDQLKKLPLLSGSLAYLGSIAVNLVLKRGEDLRVEYPDGFEHDGKLLLISVANGCFCGGGIKGLPKARYDDGMMDVSLIKDVPRRTFVRLFPRYQEGTHLDAPAIAEIVRYTKEDSLVITPRRGLMKLCVDGEIEEAGRVHFNVVPKAIKFVVPAG